MKHKPSFHNLHTLLSIPESRIQLSMFTSIPITKINNWFSPDSRVVPRADELVLMSKYFGCSMDWLLDLDDEKGIGKL